MSTNSIKTVDNLIIGGGLAGLYCAWQCQKNGEEFLLLEASDRLGGRIKTAQEIDAVDLGATWFWPHQHQIQALVQELKIPFFEQYCEGDTLFQPGNHAPVQRMHYQHGLSYRITGGSFTLVNALKDQLIATNLVTSNPVNSIEKHDKGWLTSSSKMRVTARNVFIAIPPRQIIEHLTPENWLSENSIAHLASQQTWMSAQAKYVALFGSPFWRDADLSGFAISHKGPLAEIHDASTQDTFSQEQEAGEKAALFGFIGIPAMERQAITTENLKDLCRNQLREIFGSKAVPIKDAIQDWSVEKFIASSRDLSETPQHSHISLSILKQNDELDGMHFIASEFSQTEPGYMEGALEAVNRAMQTRLGQPAISQYHYPGQPSSL